MCNIYKHIASYECKYKFIKYTCSPQHKHWPTGPAHFSDRRASTGQYIVYVTGPAGPPS